MSVPNCSPVKGAAKGKVVHVVKHVDVAVVLDAPRARVVRLLAPAVHVILESIV